MWCIISTVEHETTPNITAKESRSDELREILSSLTRTIAGSHIIFVYPDLEILRQVYTNYIKNQLDSNQIVLMVPYYETVNNVKAVLSRFRDKREGKIDVDTHIEEGSLLILDSNEVFFNHKTKGRQFDNDTNLTNNGGSLTSLMRMIQSHRRKIAKEGITILVDLGSFFSNANVGYLLKYEKSIPQFFKENTLKQVCLYHQRDFDSKFDNSTKAQLLDEHGKTVLMLNAQC